MMCQPLCHMAHRDDAGKRCDREGVRIEKQTTRSGRHGVGLLRKAHPVPEQFRQTARGCGDVADILSRRRMVMFHMDLRRRISPPSVADLLGVWRT
jgi:hypothetical protein